MERRVKTASDGYYLTDGYIYAQKVELGDWDSPDNWSEIPISELEESTIIE